MPFELVEHPLIQHKMAILRDKNTGPKEFRELTEELSALLAYEATRHLSSAPSAVETPLGAANVRVVAGGKVGIVPILRAGLGMVSGILKLIPNARVGHLGIYRDHGTLKPVEYYAKLPEDLADRDVFLLDPMLATGGSAAAAVDYLKQKGARAQAISFVCLIASQKGAEELSSRHPDIRILAAAVDEKLNKQGYIVPGLGDAGDRLFGTK